MRVLNDLAGQRDVVLKGVMRTVDHDRGETAVDAGLADLEVCAVVEVEREVNTGILDRSLCQCNEVLMLCILSCACGNLQDNGGAQFFRRLGDRLDDLHVVDVECADGVTALVSLLEHLFGCYKCHFSSPLTDNLLNP